MEGNRVRKVSAFLAAAALVASAGTASAQVTADDAACRAAILKNAGKLGGTVNKTALSLGILLVAAGYVWNRGAADPSVGAFVMVGALGGLVLALVTVFKHSWAPYTTPAYAGLEGLALGGISVAFEARYPGIVSQAVFLTFGTLGALIT